MWLLLTTALIAISAGAYFVYSLNQPRVVASQAVKDAAGYSIAEPKGLVGNLTTLQQPSYNETTKTVTTILKKDSTTITLTQQKKPQGIELEQIEPREKFLTGLGTVYVLKTDPGKHVAIIDTADSWIYVNTTSSLSYEAYKAFIKTLSQ